MTEEQIQEVCKAVKKELNRTDGPLYNPFTTLQNWLYITWSLIDEIKALQRENNDLRGKVASLEREMTARHQ